MNPPDTPGQLREIPYDGPCHNFRPRLGVGPRGAAARHQGRRFHVGTFDDEVEAAKARDRKAYELAGEFAYLNFPDEIDRR